LICIARGLAIARELGIDRKTVRKCITRGLEPPAYGPRKPRQRVIEPFVPYLRERVMAYPGLTGRRLWRELRERGYRGGYTAVTDQLRQLRPASLAPFEVRFETPPGAQAQVDFAQFQVVFTEEPAVTRIVWLFSLVLGFSRSGGASSCTRTCRRFCAVTWRRSRRPAAFLARFSMTA
jgi:transposase